MTIEELHIRQSWTLNQKIDHFIGVVSYFLSEMNGKGYVSFSGGRDSTVMLYLIRRYIDKNIPAVFCNTGNEFPEIVKFVKSFDNLTIIRPKMTMREVIGKYGFPLISKEQALYIRQAKHTKSPALKHMRMFGKIGRNGKNIKQGIISKKYQFLINAPFDVSEKCCHYLKKEPFRRYNKETGLYPIIGTIAEESQLRKQKWLAVGCNSFESKNIASYPLSIFLQRDIKQLIKMLNIPICEIYNDPRIEQTGCAICGFGCQFNDGRFYELKENRPKYYDYVMSMENNGITYREALQYCNIDFPDMKNRQLKLEFV